MNKVELAKILGLETLHDYRVDSCHVKNLLAHDYMEIDWSFNADIYVSITQEDLYEDNLNIRHDDLVKDEDIKVCIKQCEDLLWERATDEYLGKIKSLVETIKV